MEFPASSSLSDLSSFVWVSRGEFRRPAPRLELTAMRSAEAERMHSLDVPAHGDEAPFAADAFELGVRYCQAVAATGVSVSGAGGTAANRSPPGGMMPPAADQNLRHFGRGSGDFDAGFSLSNWYPFGSVGTEIIALRISFGSAWTGCRPTRRRS